MKHNFTETTKIRRVKLTFENGETLFLVPEKPIKAHSKLSFSDWILAQLAEQPVQRTTLLRRAFNKWRTHKEELHEVLVPLIESGQVGADIKPRSKGGIKYFLKSVE